LAKRETRVCEAGYFRARKGASRPRRNSVISSEKEAEIIRLFKAEVIRGPCSLGRLVGVHPDAVKRVLAQAGLVDAAKTQATVAAPRESMLNPFAPVVDQTLLKYPNICASRIFGMLKERGYKGVSQGDVRRFVNRRRPREPASNAR